MLDSVQLTATYAGIVGLQNGYLDSLFLEITLGLSKVQRSVVRRRMPCVVLVQRTITISLQLDRQTSLSKR